MAAQETEQTRAEKAYELGIDFEKKYRGCGQCTFAAVVDALGLERDELFQAATGFAGGVGLMGDGCCGAYLGGVLAMGDRVGRSRAQFDDVDGVRFQTHNLVRAYRQRFLDAYGSVICREIQTHLMGRSYDLTNPEEFDAFEEAGGHARICPVVVGSGARWVIELLEDEGLA